MRKTFFIGVGTASVFCGYYLHAHSRKLNLPEDSIQHELDKNLKLKLVQVAFRHGARTALRSPDYLPKIQYEDSLFNHDNHTFVPVETKNMEGKHIADLSETGYERRQDAMKLGELTAKGAQQMYELGDYLRKRYVSQKKFISPLYNDEIYVRSTGMRRCVESARCTLAGLFPNEKTPIPIHISGLDKEVLFPNFKRCKYLNSLTRWSFLFPDLVVGHKEERQEIQTAFGIPAETDVHIMTLNDYLIAHHHHGILPEELNISPELLMKVKLAAMKIIDLTFAGFHETRETALKLGIGPLLKLVLDNMHSSMSSSSKEKMILLSGHDTTLLPLLFSLGIHEDSAIPFGANITLELYEDARESEKKNHYVRVLYENEEKVMPGCGGVMCPMEQFQKVVSKYLVDEKEYADKCEVKHDHLLEKVPKLPPKIE